MAGKMGRFARKVTLDWLMLHLDLRCVDMFISLMDCPLSDTSWESVKPALAANSIQEFRSGQPLQPVVKIGQDGRAIHYKVTANRCIRLQWYAGLSSRGRPPLKH